MSRTAAIRCESHTPPVLEIRPKDRVAGVCVAGAFPARIHPSNARLCFVEEVQCYGVGDCGEQLADTKVPEPIVCDDDVATGLSPVGRSGSGEMGKCPCRSM